MVNLTGNKPAMKKLFFLLPVLFFIKASTQEPYDFKKFKENDIQKDLLKKYPLKIPPSGKAKGKITLSGPSGYSSLRLACEPIVVRCLRKHGV